MNSAQRLPLLLASLFLAGSLSAQSVPRTDTPSIVQLTLGPTLGDLPGFGSMYCVPTSTTMELLWLSNNGFTTLPAYDQNNPADLPIAYNLDLVIAGLMGTTGLGGTSTDGFQHGISTYLNLQGFCGLYTVDRHDSPTATDLGNYLTGYNLNIINIAWYADTGTVTSGTTIYNRNSGHDVALLAINGTNQVTINNPEPKALVTGSNVPSNVQETLSIGGIPSDIYLTGTAGESADSLQFITTKHTGTAGEKSLAVIDGLSVVQFSSSLNPVTFTPQTFHVDQELTINTNGGSFTTAAPIVSDFKITKAGSGTMTLGNTVQGDGGFAVTGGVLESLTTNADSTPALPFGSGAIFLSGGTLAVSPAAAGNGNAAILLASGSSHSLDYGAGSSSLVLNRGGNTTLTVRIGGHQGDGEKNISEEEFGTLLIRASDGPSGLGSSTKLFIEGSGSNLPSLHNGIVSPSIVVQQNNADASGAFLSYSETNGFVEAATTEGNSFTGVSGTTIFQTASDITFTGTTTVAALIASHRVSGDVLQIAPDGAEQAGVILNQGATIAASSLDFGARDAYLYSSNGGGTISSSIHTTASLVTFGPGQTTLSGLSSTISGTVYVNSGTLLVQNTGVGTAPVTVNSAATLKIAGLISGTVTAKAGSAVLLAGGTLNSAPSLSTASTLGGTGLVKSSGDLTLLGNIGSTSLGGQLTFQATGTTTVATAESATLNFTLTNLASGTSSFSQDWTGFIFANDVIIGTDADQITVGLNFSNVADPDGSSGIADSGDFWTTNHAWRFLEFDAGYAWSGSNFKFLDNYFYAGTFGFELVTGTSGAPSYVNLTYNAVPEPAAWALAAMGIGFALLLCVRRIDANRA